MIGCDRIELTDKFGQRLTNGDEVYVSNWESGRVIKLLHLVKPGTSQETVLCQCGDFKSRYSENVITNGIKINESNRWQFSR